MATYTNISDAANKPVYTTAEISQYSDATQAAYTGTVQPGALLGYYYTLAGTTEMAQDDGEANIIWLACNNAGEDHTVFYVFGEDLFLMADGSFLSQSQQTTPGLQSPAAGNSQGNNSQPGAAGSGGGGAVPVGSGSGSGSGGAGGGISFNLTPGNGSGTGSSSGSGSGYGAGILPGSGLSASGLAWLVLVAIGIVAYNSKNDKKK